MTDSPVTTRVTSLVAPILADLGMSLYDLDFGAGLLKITVDKDGGVDLEALALATRLISRELDHEDPVPGKYTLEVSSPGIERVLRRPEHFAGAIGSTVTVRLRDVTNEARRVQGILVGATDDFVTIRPDGEGADRTIPYDHIDRARTVFVWGPADKGGSSKSSKSPSKGQPKQSPKSASKNSSKNPSSKPKQPAAGRSAPSPNKPSPNKPSPNKEVNAS